MKLAVAIILIFSVICHFMLFQVLSIYKVCKVELEGEHLDYSLCAPTLFVIVTKVAAVCHWIALHAAYCLASEQRVDSVVFPFPLKKQRMM